ncbi:COX15/CtaA family protein [Teredinibacter haidensis]|uniref:COX15/CtaA family protein n=1 Tax=Teredinibacter haidensis TaxID=2731755 RepID=UPI000948F86A|nr:COX15/CtaA family protein [Teredinibacter haidensis]
MKRKSTLYKLSLLAFFMASLVVVLGAFTRLVDAGLGCPDWPTCYGHIWVPNESHEIQAANELFDETPVETDKTWPEQIHRIFASSLGLVILAIFAIAWRGREKDTKHKSVLLLLGVLVGGVIARVIVGDTLDPFMWVLVGLYFLNLLRVGKSSAPKAEPFLLPAGLAGLVILQGFFGMWTVTLKLWPQVVTAHLLGGFATISLLWLLVQRSGECQWSLPAGSVVALYQAQKIALAALILVVVQIALGGWTSSNYAALACPDFPLCQNSVIPVADYIQGFNFFQKLGPNYLGGLLDNEARTAIHFMHRIGAVLVTLFIVWLAKRLWASAEEKAKRFAWLLIAMLVLQLSLGMSNILFALPLSVAVLHNAGGAILLLILVTINHRLRTMKTL